MKFRTSMICVVLLVWGLQLHGQRPDPRLPPGVAARAAAGRGLVRRADVSVQAPTAGGDLITFDIPGAGTGSFQGTFPAGITPLGDIAGYYCNATICPGFLREANGTITTFNAPGAIHGVVVSGINPAEAITGYVFGTATSPGFVRAPYGRITLFSIGSSVTTVGINLLGKITGFYADATGYHGFLRAPTGAIMTFDVPGGVGNTYPGAIDLEGEVTGAWFDANGVAHGFLRATSGALTTFDPPNWGAPGSFLQVYGINLFDAITGYYCPGFTGACHGFLRRTYDGTFVTFDPPGSTGTLANGINLVGTITGVYSDASGVSHVFLRAPNGTFSKIDAPGAVGGYSQVAINDGGAVTGAWFDANNVAHGFLFQPK